MNIKIFKLEFLLTPIASRQYYINLPYEQFQTYRVWYVFGVRVIWYDTTIWSR